MRSSTIFWAVLFLGIAPPAHGEDRPAGTDLPLVVDASNPTEFSTLNVSCLPLTGRPKSARCTVRQLLVNRPPEASEIARRVAELDALEASAQGRTFATQACSSAAKQTSPVAPPSQPDVAGRAQLTSACKAKHTKQVFEALRCAVQHVEGETCTLHLLSPDVLDFDQVNANLWQSVGTAGLCGTIFVRTLWRAASNKPWKLQGGAKRARQRN